MYMWEKVNAPGGRNQHQKRGGDDDVSVACYDNDHGKDKGRDVSLAVRMGAGVVKELRWVIGDRITLLCDTDKKLLKLIREPNGRVSLQPNTGKAKDLKGAVGRAANAQFTVPETMRAMIGERRMVPHAVDADGLVINLTGTVV